MATPIKDTPILSGKDSDRFLKKPKENLSEALSLFLISCFEQGTLADVLRESGLMPLHAAPHTPKKTDKSKYIDIDIPFNIQSSQACHA